MHVGVQSVSQRVGSVELVVAGCLLDGQSQQVVEDATCRLVGNLISEAGKHATMFEDLLLRSPPSSQSSTDPSCTACCGADISRSCRTQSAPLRGCLHTSRHRLESSKLTNLTTSLSAPVCTALPPLAMSPGSDGTHRQAGLRSQNSAFPCASRVVTLQR